MQQLLYNSTQFIKHVAMFTFNIVWKYVIQKIRIPFSTIPLFFLLKRVFVLSAFLLLFLLGKWMNQNIYA